LGSAFFFLRCFKLAHIYIQVTSLQRCNKQGINHRFLSLAYFTWGVKLRESWTSQLQPFGCVLCEVFCSCVSDFYSRGKRVATWSSWCALKSLCRQAYYIGAVWSFFIFFDTDVILIKSVDHVLCQIFQLWRFRLVCLWQSIILFPPAKWDFNKSVQFCAFTSKAATDAVIVGTSVMIKNFLMTVLSERNFPIFANWLTLSFFSSQQWVKDPHKWISLGPGIS